MNLESPVDRFFLITQMLMKAIGTELLPHLTGESRYRLNCTFAAAHYCVLTPRNRVTIPRHYALYCTAAKAHFNLSNRGIPG